jgi:hypothetical protein
MKIENLGAQNGPENANDNVQTAPYEINREGDVELTNTAFLKHVFRNKREGEQIWLTSFPDDPASAGPKWKGRGHDLGDLQPGIFRGDHNTFYSPTSVKPNGEGVVARRAECAAQIHAIVLDDVGIKSTVPVLLPPSYAIETSPGSYHVGYLLPQPVEAAEAEALLKALANAGACDRGGNNKVRYVRLPVGRNTKAKYQTPEQPEGFSHVLREWHPDRLYTLEEIAGAYGIETGTNHQPNGGRKTPQAKSPSKGQVWALSTTRPVPKEVAEKDPYLRVLRELGHALGDLKQTDGGGWKADILCPWWDDEEHGHTPGDQARTGTAYFVGGGFKCHHSHGDELSFNDVRQWLQKEHGVDTDALDAESRRLYAQFDFEPLEDADLLKLTPHQQAQCERMRQAEEMLRQANEAFAETLRTEIKAGLSPADPSTLSQDEADKIESLASALVADFGPDGKLQPSRGLSDRSAEAQSLSGMSKRDLDSMLRNAGRRAAQISASIRDDLTNQVGEAEGNGDELPFDVPEPWPTPVDGITVANEVTGLLGMHVVFQSDHHRHALTLWVIGTYLMDEWRLWPKVLIQSPVKRCGKSTLIEVLEACVYRGMICANISAAALFRAIDAWQPALLIDEADRFLKQNEEANGIINAGHTHRTANVTRVVDQNGEQNPKQFSVWGPQAIAGIGDQADTLLDRSLVIPLRRRLPHESVSKVHRDMYDQTAELRSKLKRLAVDTAPKLDVEAAEQALPVHNGNDRAHDNWIPLYAIAAALGDSWPDRAQRAYQALASAANDNDDHGLGIRLLRDVMAVFWAEPSRGAIPTIVVRNTVIDLDERPWQNYGRSAGGISAHAFARLLRPFEVCSRDKRVKGKGIKHLFRVQVEAAYDRYCSEWADEDAQAESVTINWGEFSELD